MKLSLKSILLALLPVVIISCDDNGEITPVEQSTFVVDKSLYSVGPEGAVLEVTYSVKGPAEGLVAEVVSAEPWIEVGEVDNEKFTLNVSANETGADRMGSVTLSGENVKTLTLHVSQSKVSDSEPVHNSFAMDVFNITTSSLDVEVTPVNPNAYYYTNVLTEAVYSTMTEAQLVAAYAQNMLEYSGVYQVAPQAFLYKGYFNTAEAENVNLDLRDDTDYRVFAFDLDFDETQTPVYSGKVESIKVRTKRASQVNMTFEFEKKSGTTITITPSTSAYAYICGIASKAQWDEYVDKKDAARDYIEIAKQYGMFETILPRFK